MRTVVVGSVESSRVSLSALTSVQHPPAAIVTLSPHLASRHSDYADLSSAVDAADTEIIHTEDINDAATRDRIASFEPEFIWVVGWSQLCGPEFLSIPQGGCIGYHPALLPLLRGRAPIPWTILTHATETGGTLFWIDGGVDSGPILLQEAFPVEPAETATSLYSKHMGALSGLVHRATDALVTDSPRREPQDESKATYCAKRRWQDGLISWDWPAAKVWDLIRASTRPYPGAFTFLEDEVFIIWNADLLDTKAYVGVPGQVQGFDEDQAIVMCGDGQCILVKEAVLARPSSRPERLRIHQRLGVVDPFVRIIR